MTHLGSANPGAVENQVTNRPINIDEVTLEDDDSEEETLAQDAVKQSKRNRSQNREVITTQGKNTRASQLLKPPSPALQDMQKELEKRLQRRQELEDWIAQAVIAG